ncbi:trafficking protein particle complex subunit 10 isoform X1 [Corythoichthys intestinalis]|uniref:trafficking protein particle complex subunit 10 isoform X1 n=1 Tax=Corythoichthys intestinalis TaxID=161448 RepID=UPI0025A53EF9|nr:trafficking protein particle complex subunit 10 isoform X1 [Corythoichthys intestinalis]
MDKAAVIYTMENKPIVTCAGDQALFTSLYTSLAQQLPREPMEWRRTYGRPPKMIHLEANFVQFKEDLLPKDGTKALLTFPFLHIYWTDCCDTEAYRNSVKEDVSRWQSSLRSHGSADWVIIVVDGGDARKKNKSNILPRSSIVDKIRGDFCNKQNDRCVVLSEPMKDSSRSQESWNALLLKLRTLLLMSFTKNLGRFEDDMRTLREKRTQPGWSFCQYFMVQEELAFVFEMLQQFEDALVQYDELDALFTQYVLNFAAGDTAKWLGSFCSPVSNWSGLLLRRPIDMEKRDGIQRGSTGLLDLRGYLFSRQCTLLIFLQRPWEVTRRALELLHNCVHELRLLEVSVLEGALDCWVFLSCLEVLHRIESCCDQPQLAANSAHTVGLWAYATEKLKSLGKLCGLASRQGPTSEDLNRTVDLLAGLGDERPETVNSLQSPYKKLKEALSSVEAFERHYLELSQAAMEMYRAIGRRRSARLLGKSLAEFYMSKGEPEQAEILLSDALASYVSEGWSFPVTHTRKQIAECQKLLGRSVDSLKTSALLAGDANLDADERTRFCRDVLDFAGDDGERRPAAFGEPVGADVPSCPPAGSVKSSLDMGVFAKLTRLQFRPDGACVHSGALLQVELTLHCLMPVPVHVEELAVSLHLDAEHGSKGQRHGSGTGGAFPDTVDLEAAVSPPGRPSSLSAGPVPEMDEAHDRSPTDNSLSSAGVVCKNAHLVIRRHDGSPQDEPRAPAGNPPTNAPTVALKEGARVLRTRDITLEPGDNSVVLTAPSDESGTYTLRQLCVALARVNFVLPHLYPAVQYHVYSQEPQLSVQPLSEPLLAGLPQTVKFTLLTGHYAVKKGDALQLSNSHGMPVLTRASCAARVSNTSAAARESVLSVQSSDKVTSISLPPTPPYHTLEFQLEVLCLIPPGPERPADERLTNGEVRRRPRSYSHPDTAMTAVDQRMSIDCPWSIYSTLLALTFHIPFKTEHSLLSAGNRKYIQVCVRNVSDSDFALAQVKLAEKRPPRQEREQQLRPELEMRSLNAAAEQLLCSKQSVFCLWEVTSAGELPSGVACVFSAGFFPRGHRGATDAFELFHYHFQLDRVPTLYSVKADIVPPAGERHCRSGALCGLEVLIARLSSPADDEKADADGKLMYEVADSSSNWAVCGKSSGLVSLPSAAASPHRVQIEVMPLFAGHLPFPKIQVLKYLPHNAAVQPDADGPVENDSLSLLDEAAADTASVRSRGSVQSLGEQQQQQRGAAMPRLDPFSPGQVFNHSHARQVLVLPAADDHIMEVHAT